MKYPILPCVLLVAAAAGCGDGKNSAAGGADAAGASGQSAGGAPPADHGAATDLGTLTILGRVFRVARLGDLTPGVEGAVQVLPVDQPAADVAKLNLYVWVESADGTQLSAAAKGGLDSGALHFHVTPRAGDKEPYRVVLRLRVDGKDERAGLPLDGHGHEHLDGPHDGLLATFAAAGGSGAGGRLELKLHDDKGDLELWLAQGQASAEPFDLPLDAAIEVEFVDVGGRKVTLQARNHEANEDEEGHANVRDGRTNYFIFPGGSGQDPTWLQGREFESIVVVRFTRDGESFVSEEFVLKPHVH